MGEKTLIAFMGRSCKVFDACNFSPGAESWTVLNETYWKAGVTKRVSLLCRNSSYGRKKNYRIGPVLAGGI
jgi:hypothetical protein